MKYLIIGILLNVYSGIGFTSLGVSDGLSQNTVLSITQTKNKDMWFATYNGFNRYDGYEVTVMNHGLVHFLTTDTKDRLWVATEQAVEIYSGDEKKIAYESDDLLVYDIQELFENDYLVATNTGLIELVEDEQGKFTAFSFRKMDWRGCTFAKIDNTLYISRRYTKEVYQMNLDKMNLTLLDYLPPIEEISHLAIAGGELWISSNGDGLFRVDTEKKKYRRYTQGPKGICSNFVRCICPDHDRNIWVATANSVSIINSVTEEITNISSDLSNPRSLTNNSIKSLYCSSDGGMWLGTFYGGANYYHPLRDRFQRNDELGTMIIGALAKSPDGKTWVGTNRFGIYIMDSKGKVSKRIKLSNSPEKNDIKSIVFSQDGKRVFVCSAIGGISILDRKSGAKLANIPYPSTTYDLVEDKEGILWVCSMSGVFFCDPHTKTTGKLKIEGIDYIHAYKIVQDWEGYFWIGSRNGLIKCKFHLSDKGPEITETSIRKEISKVQDILISSDGTLWVASLDGLWSIKDGQVEAHELSSSSTSTKSIVEDNNGILWIGTDNGLCRYSPEERSSHIFTVKDGIPNNSFSPNSKLRDSDGSIILGSVSGLVEFSPYMMNSNKGIPAEITSVKANGAILKPDSKGRYHLKEKENSFEINFTAHDYISWQKGSFFYKMEGLDEDWRRAGQSRNVWYTKVRGGNYRFLLTYENSDGIDAEDLTSISIHVNKPWFVSLYAIAAYILLLISLIYCIVKFYVRKAEEISRKRMEKMVSEKQKEIEVLRKLSESNMRSSISMRFCGGRELSNADYEFLSKVLQIVTSNISNEEFSVEQLADEAGYGRTRLHTKIKALTENSALDFIRKVRFDEACRQLELGELTISEIAYKVGFKTPAYFSTSFKAYTGLSPKEWQETQEK